MKQCESERQDMESTTNHCKIKLTEKQSDTKVNCSQISNGNKNRLDHESFDQSIEEKLLDLDPEVCKNELKLLEVVQNKK